MLSQPNFAGVLNITSSRYAFDQLGGTVGHMEVLVNGNSTDVLSLFNGFGSRFPIVRLAEHPNCPGGDNLEYPYYNTLLPPFASHAGRLQ
jgi:hypothetical protein